MIIQVAAIIAFPIAICSEPLFVGRYIPARRARAVRVVDAIRYWFQVFPNGVKRGR